MVEGTEQCQRDAGGGGGGGRAPPFLLSSTSTRFVPARDCQSKSYANNVPAMLTT